MSWLPALGFGLLASSPVAAILALRWSRLRGAMGATARSAFLRGSAALLGASLLACSCLARYAGAMALPLVAELALPAIAALLLFGLLRRGA